MLSYMLYVVWADYCNFFAGKIFPLSIYIDKVGKSEEISRFLNLGTHYFLLEDVSL